MSTLQIQLFGPPRLTRDGALVHLERRRTLAFTSYLALTGQEEHRERLLALFWPESDPSHARADLRRTIYQVNHRLGEGWLTTDGERIALPPRPDLWVDVAHFRQRLAACRDHGHAADAVCPACLPLLGEAVTLYTNDFLAGFSLPDSPAFDDWQFFQGEALRSELASALERLVQGHAERDELTLAIAYAQRWLALDPLHEPVHRWLMQLYAWDDQQAAALRQHARCVRLLAEELGVPPAAETEQLYQAIRSRRLAPLLPRRRPTTRDGAPIASAEAAVDEIRLITVLSAGLSATPLDELATATARLQALVQESSAPLGGQVERVIGEELLVFFGLEQTHEDDAERAVRTALALHQAAPTQGLALHIGMTTGLAYCRRQGQDASAEHTVLGPVVTVATRLRNEADAGQTLVGRQTYLATRGLCDYTAVALPLPGQTESLPAYALVRPRPQSTKARGLEGRQTPLVGRDGELSHLRAALTQAMNGEGQLVIISGNAGVGKSRLVAELKEDFRFAILDFGLQAAEPQSKIQNPKSKILWLEGRGVEFALGVSYALFADLLRGYVGGGEEQALARHLVEAVQGLGEEGLVTADEMAEIGALVGRLLAVPTAAGWEERLAGVNPNQVRQRTLVAIQRLVVALTRRQPLVLLFEDLQWADALSLDLLAALLETLIGAPLLLLCLYRPEEQQAHEPLLALAQHKCAERLTVIRLHALTPTHSRQLVSALLATSTLPAAAESAILAKAQGNPFFLEEIVRAYIDSGLLYRVGESWQMSSPEQTAALPTTVQSMILSRVDRLAPASKAVIQIAAVQGRIFHLPLLAAVVPADLDLAEALDQLTAQNLIYHERTLPEREYSFHHVLLQAAIYYALPQTRRRDLHGQTAAALETLYAASLAPYVEQLAYHYEQSAVDAKAIVYLLQAGQKSQRAYLNQEAVAYFNRALARNAALAEQADPNWRLAALRGLGEVYAALGNLAEAEPPLRQAMALAADLGLPATEQVRLYFPLCHLYRWLGRFEAISQVGRAALALLGDDAESPEAVMMLTFLATGAYLTGHRRQYRALAALIVASLHQLPFSQQLVTAYGVAAWWQRDTKRVSAALTWVATLRAEAQRRHDLWALGYLWGVSDHWLHEAIGDLHYLATTMEAALELAGTIGDTVLRGYTLNFLGFIYWGQGDLRRAAAVHQESLALHLQSQALHMRVLSRIGLALVHICQGNISATIALLEQALLDADSIRYRVHGVQQGRLALAAAYQVHGRTAEAVALYQRVAIEDEADSDGQVWITDALAGLERALVEPAPFEAVCRHIATQRPADDPLPLVQWWLKPTEPDFGFSIFDFRLIVNACGEEQAKIENPKSKIAPGWAWHDPYGDCSFTLDATGLVMVAANYLRDLWFNNQSAPRFLHAVQGDFAAEAHCVAAAAALQPAAGGLVLWQDAQHFLRLDWGIDGPRSVSLRGAINNRDLVLGRGCLPEEHQAFLRLERCGEQVRAVASSDGQQWFLVAETIFAATAPLQVGLFAGGLLHRWFYPGKDAAGSALRVQGLTVMRQP